MKGFIWVFVIGLAVCNAERKCGMTPTTVSGLKAPRRICSGDLIFYDNFRELDFEKWKHENTLSGGGVSKLYYLLLLFKMKQFC